MQSAGVGQAGAFTCVILRTPAPKMRPAYEAAVCMFDELSNFEPVLSRTNLAKV